jgi:Ras-related protein Rab-8A
MCHRHRRHCSTERAQAMAAEYGVPYIESSARDNINIEEAFVMLATAVVRLRASEEAAAAAGGGGGGWVTGQGGGVGGAAETVPLAAGAGPAGGTSKGGCC